MSTSPATRRRPGWLVSCRSLVDLPRPDVQTKEQADHSLPYLVAVALLDGEVTPRQFLPERIRRPDVQALLHRVTVRPKTIVDKPKPLVERLDPYTRRYPDEMPCHIMVALRDGRRFECEKRDYLGFHTRPLPWEAVVEKFDRLSAGHAGTALRRDIVAAVDALETLPVADLTALLARVGTEVAS